MIGVDAYLRALIKTKITIDSASVVRLGDEVMAVTIVNGTRKVQLPGTKFLITLDDLVQLGAKVLGGRTPNFLALQGATARWADRQEIRQAQGLIPNVYIANARSIEYAIKTGRVPPVVRYIGRRQEKMTEVFDTVDEVVQAMNEGRWRTTFRRGHAQKWMIPKEKNNGNKE